ncbi:trehalose-phosphatase [Nocardioides sp. Kera G14]|uniref:trehalose-phosphatase n=1 Tax=Nocardioides sp. Kera G14 TaxID=2884264 RepID=UPI001D0FED96|nr:trehalose-phosphatase [Nocardioides sp. Kera G14]UDY24207.1 trehalose-phosphatase [Nocardioides sp. Kera G14]
MRWVSDEGEQRYAALLQVAPDTLVALDFDGTLSPIVDDPAKARIHPDAADVLVALASKVAAIAVVTGRPARQVLDLGGLEEVADRMAGTGAELRVFGQYGAERWSSSHRVVSSPRPPAGLATFERDLPRLLRQADAADAWIEDKGLAVAVHTRRLDDAEAAFERLLPILTAAAESHDLEVEPGRLVVEIRGGGTDKGIVVDRLITSLPAKGVLFAGDDLGDLEAFQTIKAWAGEGLATLLVCSGSEEQSALVPLADVVVPGPDGVLELLSRVASDLS